MSESLRKPLRLWPGVVIVILQILIRYVSPRVDPGILVYAVFGGVIGTALVLLWWLFLSRAPWVERLGAIALMVAAFYATWRIVDISIAKGAMGYFPFLAVPFVGITLVAWAVVTRNFSNGIRRVTMAATILATMRRKGVVGGALDTGLNAVPFVGAAKNVFELMRGRDFIPDRRAL